MKPTPIVIPDFPQLEAKLINSTQRSPKPEQLVWRFCPVGSTRVKFDHQLFDVGQTSWIGKYCVERGPFRALDVDL